MTSKVSFTATQLSKMGVLAVLLTLGHTGTLSAAGQMRAELSPANKKPNPESTVTATQTPVAAGPNPFLSYLPAESTPDFKAWTKKLHERGVNRKATRKTNQSKSAAVQPTIVTTENEPFGVLGQNDDVATSQQIAGLGTGVGQDNTADITGDLRALPAPAVIGPFAEDDGDIGSASIANMTSGDGIATSAVIGDGPFGGSTIETVVGPFDEDDGDLVVANESGVILGEKALTDGVTSVIGDGPFGSSGTQSGDIDVYSFTIDIAGPTNLQTAILRVDNPVGNTSLDPILGVYDAAGTLLFTDDDSGGNFQSALSVDFSCDPAPPCTTTYYLAVAGWFNAATVDSFLTDSFDSATGPGVGSEGPYVASIELATQSSGDFDFYAVDLVAGDTVVIDVNTPSPFADLDSILAVYSPAGVLSALNDDGDASSYDSQIVFEAIETGTHYVAVGGFNNAVFPTSPFSFPLDPFDSSTGPGRGSEGSYDLTIYRNAADLDFYSFELQIGDIVGANVFACLVCADGESPQIGLFRENEDVLVATGSDLGGILPTQSPLPFGGNASIAYVVDRSGTYAVGVGFGSGDYALELSLHRPPQETSGETQILFLDFDGATIDTSIFGSTLDPTAQPATLSPLSDFLGNWGLAPSDENAVIDSILTSVQEGLDADPRYTGPNPTFNIDLQNSRDHTDPFPGNNVSRIIVGGTIAESGISTLGIAESIDIGNWNQEESALVLLDLLSESPANPNSLNGVILDPGVTMVDLVGVAVGNITTHEAGHFFANFHTDRTNGKKNIMDSGGGPITDSAGVGNDFVFGTNDDVDIDFGADDYAPEEGFVGVENTLDGIGFSLSTGSAPPFAAGDISGDWNSNLNSDVGVLLRDENVGRNFVYVVDGGTDAQLAKVAMGPEVALDYTAIPDMTGDGIPEHAVLVKDTRLARIKNPVTGALLGIPPFNGVLDPVAMVSVGDADGDLGQDLAVVGRDAATGLLQVQVKRISNGSLISRYNYAKDYDPIGVVVVDNVADTAANEIAVVGVDDEGRVRAQIKDAQSGNLVNIVYFSRLFSPIAVAALPDPSGDNTYIAVLGRDTTGVIRAQIKRAIDSSLVSIVRFDDNFYPISLVSSVDSNANGSGEVGVVGINASGLVRAQIKEIETAVPLSIVGFDPNFPPLEAFTVNGVAGTGRTEIAVLGVDSNGQHRLQIKDLLTGTAVNNILVQ